MGASVPWRVRYLKPVECEQIVYAVTSDDAAESVKDEDGVIRVLSVKPTEDHD